MIFVSENASNKFIEGFTKSEYYKKLLRSGKRPGVRGCWIKTSVAEDKYAIAHLYTAACYRQIETPLVLPNDYMWGCTIKDCKLNLD